MTEITSSYGGRGPLLVVVGWTTLLIGVSVVLVRAYTAFFVVRFVKWDFWFTLLALLCAISGLPLLILAARNGIGNHINLVAEEDLAEGLKYQWAYHTTSIMSTVFSKLAIGCLLLQIQAKTYPKMRILLIFVVVSTTLWGINQSILIYFQCWPVDALWKTNAPQNHEQCPRVHSILYVGTLQGSWSAAGDFILAVYPSFIFWRLQTGIWRRLGLCLLFCGGTVAGVAAVLKTYYILSLSSATDATSAITPLLVWEQIEMILLIVMGSIPPLRPLFVKVFRMGSQALSKNYANSSGLQRSGDARLSIRMGRSVDIETKAVEDPDRDNSTENILMQDRNEPGADSSIWITHQLSVDSAPASNYSKVTSTKDPQWKPSWR